MRGEYVESEMDVVRETGLRTGVRDRCVGV